MHPLRLRALLLANPPQRTDEIGRLQISWDDLLMQDWSNSGTACSVAHLDKDLA